jgi:uncharacterized protein YndB with AHSA1/START domain
MKRKRSILKKVLIVLVVIVGGFLVVVAMQPSEFRVTRSARFAAPPEAAFALVNDFHKWEAWSPWAKLDPSAKNSFEGPTAGTGAKFAWAGNDKVGEGHMEILESRPSDLIRINLAFVKPMEGTSLTEFAFKPDGDQTTNVTWTMSGRHSFVEKAFCLFMNMDKMVGGDFERGLATMKTLAESAAKK